MTLLFLGSIILIGFYESLKPVISFSTPHPFKFTKSKFSNSFIKQSNSRSRLSSGGAEANKLTVDTDERINRIELNDELKSSFMAYAMSTILSRALPDARDGLKPVHRRVLYAMYGLNLSPDSSFRKCARIVGEVLGKFHPHGDQSVYDALVRMAQDFVMLHPLVLGQGNFGSVDADPAAAMRYTEAKLSSLAQDSLLDDIRDDTVDFTANFDGNEIEPVVLPARLPTLLLNGASGIAVGMATNIPPHNLGEIVDAIVAMIDNPEISDEELIKLVPAPDFPTGGLIIGLEGARKLYKTGHGGILVRAKCHVETITTNSKTQSRTRTAIVVTELPYMTNKAELLTKIADLVNDKKLDGVADLRDESDREGIRVVIELKRDAVPALVQNNLFKKTGLQMSFSGNMLALVDSGTTPKRINLKTCLQVFLEFRFKTIRRRTNHLLTKAKGREHIVEGMLMAIQRIDDIIVVMKTSADGAAAKMKLSSDEFKFSEEQAESILGLTLRRLTGMEEKKLKEELDDLRKQIEKLNKIMKDDKTVMKVIKKETMDLKDKHGIPRRSKIILGEDGELNEEDLIPNDRSVIITTESGYIKRMPIEEFESQSRGGKGKAGAKLSTEEDTVSQFFTCNDHDSIIFISDRYHHHPLTVSILPPHADLHHSGKAYGIKAHKIPVASRAAKGTPIPQILPISSDSSVASILPIDKFREEEFIVLLTTKGTVKKTPLNAFESISMRGLNIITLRDDESVKWVRKCRQDDEIFIATRYGFGTCYAASDIPSTGRTSRGVKALSLREGDSMADMDVLISNKGGNGEEGSNHKNSSDTNSTSAFLLAVTDKGIGKRIAIDQIKVQRRGGKGVSVIKFKKAANHTEEDALCCMRVCSSGDEIVLSTSRGTVIRQKVDDISTLSKRAAGVIIQRPGANDTIIMVDIVPAASIRELPMEMMKSQDIVSDIQVSIDPSIVMNQEKLLAID